MQLPSSMLKLPNDVNANDSATNQWFDWLSEESKWCYTCGMLFYAIFWCLSNDDVKFSYIEILMKTRACISKYFILSFNMKTFRAEQANRLFCTTWSTWNNRKTLNLTQSSCLKWRFRCSSRRSFLNSLLYIRLQVKPKSTFIYYYGENDSDEKQDETSDEDVLNMEPAISPRPR